MERGGLGERSKAFDVPHRQGAKDRLSLQRPDDGGHPDAREKHPRRLEPHGQGYSTRHKENPRGKPKPAGNPGQHGAGEPDGTGQG